MFAPKPMTVAIDKATSEQLIGPDFSKNTDVVNMIRARGDGVKESLKAIKKRLKNKNPKVQLLSLNLLDFIVKQLKEQYIYQLIASETFREIVNQVEKVDTSRQVAERMLGLIEEWATVFPNYAGSALHATYTRLKQSGVLFPARDSRPQPMMNAPGSSSSPPGSHRGSVESYAYGGSDRYRDEPSAPPVPVSDASVSDKLRKDLDVVRNNISLTTEMLNAASNWREVKENDILSELVNTLREMEKRLVRLIPEIASESLMFECLGVNDDLQKVLDRYDIMCIPGSEFTPVTSSAPAPAPSSGTVDIFSFTAPSAAASSASDINSDLASLNLGGSSTIHEEDEEDEFATLALRRNQNARASSSSTDPLANMYSSTSSYNSAPGYVSAPGYASGPPLPAAPASVMPAYPSLYNTAAPAPMYAPVPAPMYGSPSGYAQPAPIHGGMYATSYAAVPLPVPAPAPAPSSQPMDPAQQKHIDDLFS
eukprot:GILI01008417.1.p1 GENE.GILI01008417.1~~GILI01008417.1.p1  ORF type:complete len:512 (+),score=106.36 GILI01008417.1:94-1536(+)